MTTALSVKSGTKTALFVALMSGSSHVAAQDVPLPAIPAPPAVVQPAAPAPVTPPPIVRTLPTNNDVVNPAASQQVADEQQARTAASPAAVKKAPARVQPTRATQVNVSAPTAESVAETATDPVAAAPIFNEPSSNTPPSGTVSDGIPTVDSANALRQASAPGDAGGDDLPLFAGIAAALAALGVGGLFAARRRRVPVAGLPEIKERYVAPASAPTPAATILAFAPAAPAQVQPAFAPQYSAEPPRERPQVNTRPDVPVTDPLFSRKVIPGPITDPMFAPRNDVQTPITDPLFAKHHAFAGRLRDAKPAPTPEPEPVK